VIFKISLINSVVQKRLKIIASKGESKRRIFQDRKGTVREIKG
jgi:hypothetical protein